MKVQLQEIECVGAHLRILPILGLALAHFSILKMAAKLKMGWVNHAHLKISQILLAHLKIRLLINLFRLFISSILLFKRILYVIYNKHI